MMLRVVGVAAGVAAAAGAQPPERPIATFRHDLGGAATLRAYPPEPAEVLREPEAMANRLYGAIRSRSPRTPYFCAWRDPGAAGIGRVRTGPPDAILLGCRFGTAPWTPPAALAEQAREAGRRDEAVMTLGWTRRDDAYVLDRLEVQVTDAATGRRFRSAWSGAEVARIRMTAARFTFPSRREDPLGFAFTAAVPRRENPGAPATTPVVRIRVEGRAPAIPDWMLY